MLKILNILLVLLLSFSVYAAETKPSDESLKKLLTITESHKLVDGITQQIDARMKDSLQQFLKGKTLSDKEQKTINTMREKMVAVLQENISWTQLEPTYLQVYKETFSQEEIDGMIAFYQTPAGQAVIKKMPLLMQFIMADTQKRMLALMPKIQKIQAEAMAELKKTSPKK